MTNSETYIEVKNLCKSYEEVKAISDINFNVNKGELFGFIGPDGAGKTTLFRIITTLLLANKGTVKVNGFDVVKDFKKIRNIIGYMPGKFSLYYDLTVQENLKFFATVFGTSIEENYNLVKDIYSQIEPFKNRKAGALSGGMKQKLALSCALIHKPELLVLDEPTTGVDAVSRVEFWEMLKKLKEQGITIIVSTPYMDEAEKCDRVALIQNGKILKINSPDEITNDYQYDIYSVKSNNVYQLLTDLRKFDKIKSAFPFGQHVHCVLNTKNLGKQSIIEYLNRKGNSDFIIHNTKPTIEDCFMELMIKNH